MAGAGATADLGQPNYCAPLKAFDSVERFDIKPKQLYAWKLEYSGGSGGPVGGTAPYKLTWTFAGVPMEVDLTEPISEILIRAYSGKADTSMTVIPQRFKDNFKSCPTSHDFSTEDALVSAAEGAKWRRISLEHLSQKFVLEGWAQFDFDPADPPLRSHLAFQIKLNCNTPPIDLPAPMDIASAPWRWRAQFGPGGMEAQNVRSIRRVMAREIYVPYGKIMNSKLPAAHTFQLLVKDGHWEKNDLIRFDSFAAGGGVHVVKATYHLESADECCRITQWYETRPTLNPWNNADRGKLPYPTTGLPGNIVADSALYPVEVFVPITYYEWLPKCKDVELSRMELNTRANWPLGDRKPNRNAVGGSTRELASEFSRDPNSLTGDFGTTWRYGVEFLEVDTDPTPDEARLMHEQTAVAFIDNAPRPDTWDNYHFSPIHREIDAPGGIEGLLGHITPPGCPECVHIHWRWGDFLLWPDGRPLIPRREQGCWPNEPLQTVVTYALRHNAQQKRSDFSAIQNGENLTFNIGKPGSYVLFAFNQAFGYEAHSKALSNAFFAHGMSFNGRWSEANERLNYVGFRTLNGTPPTGTN